MCFKSVFVCSIKNQRMKEEQEDVDSKTIRGFGIAVVAIPAPPPPSPLHRSRRQRHSEIDKIPSLQAVFYWSPHSY